MIFAHCLTILLIWFTTSTIVIAQHKTDSRFFKGKLKLSMIRNVGRGLDKMEIFNNGYRKKNLSGGGGIGGGLGIYYVTQKKFVFGFSAFHQVSYSKRDMFRSQGHFKRQAITADLKLPLITYDYHRFYLGVGYSKLFGLMRFDIGSFVIDYDYFPANGTHLLLEYEAEFENKAISIGLRYYHVNYSWREFIYTHYYWGSRPPTYFNFQELFEVDGSGIDWVMTFSFFSTRRSP